ncbi:adenylate cyclase, partial [Pediococcus acidilactici]
EFPIEEGLLAIDESWGDNLHDFELELEVGDASVGKIAFINFLKRFSLPYRPAKNKIQRMLEAKN